MHALGWIWRLHKRKVDFFIEKLCLKEYDRILLIMMIHT